jgi:hypothetical protein
MEPHEGKLTVRSLRRKRRRQDESSEVGEVKPKGDSHPSGRKRKSEVIDQLEGGEEEGASCGDPSNT